MEWALVILVATLVVATVVVVRDRRRRGGFDPLAPPPTSVTTLEAEIEATRAQLNARPHAVARRLPLDPATGMPRLVPPPPPGPLDHAGYQQLLDHLATQLADEAFSTPLAEEEVAANGAAFAARAGLRLVIDYTARRVEALAPATPPADVRAQHEQLLAAYTAFLAAARRLDADPRYADDDPGLEVALGAMPEAARVAQATAAIAAAGYHPELD